MSARAKFVFLSLCFLPFSSARANGVPQKTLPQEPLTIQTTNEKVTFNVEVARTAKEQEIGLMFRQGIGDDEGMLFPMPGQRYVQMWMKNTLIPLDMLFIDHAGKIVAIVTNTTPLSEELIDPQVRASAVLELKAGSVLRHYIYDGDQVIHPEFQPESNP